MSNLRGVLTQLLKELDQICRENDLRYYIWGGTCIGAIRHGGFVPWDDDIDVGMPRADYEKLEAIIDEYMPEGRELVSVNRYDTYTSPIPRYMDLTTTALRSGRLGDGTECGECIEIFILDPMPIDPVENAQWKKLLYVYCEILCTAWIQAKRKFKKEFVDVDLYEEYRKKCDTIGRKAVLKELEEKLFNIDEKDAEKCCLRWMPRGFYEFSIRCCGTPKDIEYEGMTVYAPERAPEILQEYIGYSWRNLLPPSARGIHPTLVNHDLDCGICEKEFYQIRSNAEMDADMQKAKDMGIAYYKARNAAFEKRMQPIIDFAILKTEKNIAKHPLDELRRDDNLSMEVFEEYLRLQRTSVLRDNDILVPLKDEYVDIIAQTLLNKSMIQQLNDILRIKKRRASLTDIQADLYQASEDFLKMAVHQDCDEWDEAETIAKKYWEKYPHHCWLYRCFLCKALKDASAKADYEKTKLLAEEALAKYPNDDITRKRYADILLKLGDEKKAREIYTEVSKETINGLLLREMKEFGIEEAALKLDAKVWAFN